MAHAIRSSDACFGPPTGAQRGTHLARFILVALYTGTRSDAILSMRFMPNTEGGWVDTGKGMMHRRGVGQAETNKRTPSAPIPRPLLAHLRRWERAGGRYVVEVGGQRVASVKTAWKRALADANIDHCTRHDLRHTAITWAMQRGMDRWLAAGFFGVTMDDAGADLCTPSSRLPTRRRRDNGAEIVNRFCALHSFNRFEAVRT